MEKRPWVSVGSRERLLKECLAQATEATYQQMPRSLLSRLFGWRARGTNEGTTPAGFPRALMDAWECRGSAFTTQQRVALRIDGLLPPAVETLDMQVARAMRHVREYNTPLQRYQYLENLHVRNVTLFYRVLTEHLTELLPVIYTPTVGDACRRFGQIFRSTSGMYLSSQLHRGRVRAVLDNWPYTPDIIVATDGGRILGLGDLGVNGMGIPIGKLHLYVAGGGFHPTRTLPIQLDVGCDTPEVVDDPLYMGSRMPRLKGDAHESMVDELMAAVADKWPHCIVQFEDFRTEDALRYLTKYRHTYKHFNDDIQGTAAAVAAGFLNGMKAQRTALADARIIMYGAGSSAVGVALVLRQALERAGLSTEEARQRIYMVDSKGLITSSRGDRDTLSSWKQQFARTDGTPDMTQLADIVQHVRPHALFGLTGAGPSFGREVVVRMVEGCEGRPPLIFPLSNPTSKAEITLADAVRWSDGNLLFAAGSPTADVQHNGTTVFGSQANNMLIFPGVGMGARLARASTITDGMLLAAAFTVADFVPASDVARGKLYPDLQHLRTIGQAITKAVWVAAAAEGVAAVPPPADISQVVAAAFWTPSYADDSSPESAQNQPLCSR